MTGDRLDFVLPAELEAGAPAEARGLTRDSVRMMVAYREETRLVHSTFTLFPTFLEPGDLLVINTSATLPAALTGVDPRHRRPVTVHLSTHLGGPLWVVEPRCSTGGSTRRWTLEDGRPPGELILGEDGSRLWLLEPYRDSSRLWVARLELTAPAGRWLARHGAPIRYGYVKHPWPLSDYQNVYASVPGSAEMPSAGRPFTPEVITRLVAKGVGVTPVVLHTGVASLEAGELPYPEAFEVPTSTAWRVNHTRAYGGRVVAVGTTVVRALESAFHPGAAEVRAVRGWTDLVIDAERGVSTVDGLLTGWHEPEASHLLMLEAVAGRPLLDASYRSSLAEGYLWHEFGDVHLILP